MNAQLKGVEVEAAPMRYDEFAVEDGFGGKLLAKRLDHLGKVSIEGLLVPALYKDLVAIPKNEYAKAVPFGLVYPCARRRDLVDAFGQHREDGRIDGKVHARGGRDRFTQREMRQSSCSVVR